MSELFYFSLFSSLNGPLEVLLCPSYKQKISSFEVFPPLPSILQYLSVIFFFWRLCVHYNNFLFLFFGDREPRVGFPLSGFAGIMEWELGYFFFLSFCFFLHLFICGVCIFPKLFARYFFLCVLLLVRFSLQSK